MSESQLQAACYQWLHNTYPQLRNLFFAVPNGGVRDIREASALKATGTVPGIPDCVLIAPQVTGFEFKTEKGVVSPVQAIVHQKWLQAGIPVHIVRSLQEFKRIVEGIV